MKLSVLVTGGAGFLGANLVQFLLESGFKVTILDNLSRGKAIAPGINHLIKKDLLELQSEDIEDDFDFIIHLASLAYVEESVKNPGVYFRNNVEGLIRLLKIFKDRSVKGLIFSSSMAVYGDTSKTVDEESVCMPINPYGQSKLISERVLSLFSEYSDVATVSLRLPNLCGIGMYPGLGESHEPETHIIPNVLKEALRTLNGGDPEQTGLIVYGRRDKKSEFDGCVRDFLNIKDVCEAILLVIESIETGQLKQSSVYNLSSNQPTSITQIITLMREISKEPIKFISQPYREGDPPYLYGSSDRFQSQMRWTPKYSSNKSIVSELWRDAIKVKD